MKTHIVIAALIVATTSFAHAQSTTATSNTTKPLQAAPPPPPSAQTQNGQSGKAVIPPAAREGEKGLRVGEGAADAGPVEVKRVK